MAHYGKVENGKVVQIFKQKPQWFDDNKKIVSDAYLESRNIFRINTNEVTSFDSRKEAIRFRDKSELVFDATNKIINNYIYKVRRSSQDVYSEKKDAINSIRNSSLCRRNEIGNTFILWKIQRSKGKISS